MKMRNYFRKSTTPEQGVVTPPSELTEGDIDVDSEIKDMNAKIDALEQRPTTKAPLLTPSEQAKADTLGITPEEYLRRGKNLGTLGKAALAVTAVGLAVGLASQKEEGNEQPAPNPAMLTQEQTDPTYVTPDGRTVAVVDEKYELPQDPHDMVVTVEADQITKSS